MGRPIQDIAIGGYVPGDSILHRLDPRVKLMGLLLLLIGIFLTRNPVGAAINLCLVGSLAVLSEAGRRIWLWGLRRFAWMLVMVAVINLALNWHGTRITVLGWESPISTQGLKNSGLFTVGLVQAILLSMTLTFTTTPRQLTAAFQRMASPLKRLGAPVDEIALVLLLAMRFIPQLQMETMGIVDAQKARGVEFGSGKLSDRAANFIAVLGPAMTASFRRADSLATAMTARGFQPGKARSEHKPLRFSKIDWLAGCLTGLFFLGQIILFR